MLWIKRFAVAFVIVGIVLGALYLVGECVVIFSDVRQIAEDKFSDALEARVSVGSAHLAFLNQVVLGELEIEQGDKDKDFLVANVGRVVFRYNVTDLFQRKFGFPSDVRLDSPKFVVKSPLLPLNLLRDFLEFIKQGVVPDSVSIRGGDLSLNFSKWNLTIALTDIKGDVLSPGKNKVAINLEAKPTGRDGGKIKITGEADPLRGSYDINCTFERASFGNLAVRDIEGQVWLRDGQIIVQDLKFLFNNMRVTVQGVVHDIESSPRLDLAFDIQERDVQATIRLDGPYEKAPQKGSVNLLGFA